MDYKYYMVRKVLNRSLLLSFENKGFEKELKK